MGKVIAVDLKSRDHIEIEIEIELESAPRLKVIGCNELLQLVRGYQEKFGKDLSMWPDPTGNRHSEILLREALLKLKGQWQPPYSEAELCHCRSVATQLVDQAIIGGAHTAEAVSRQTSASTACGTCRPHVEELIKFRLR